METASTKSIFKTPGYEDHRIREDVSVNWIKKVVVEVCAARQHRAECRQLQKQPSWFSDDIGPKRDR